MHACTFLRSCPGLEDVVGSLFIVGRETACFSKLLLKDDFTFFVILRFGLATCAVFGTGAGILIPVEKCDCEKKI